MEKVKSAWEDMGFVDFEEREKKTLLLMKIRKICKTKKIDRLKLIFNLDLGLFSLGDDLDSLISGSWVEDITSENLEKILKTLEDRFIKKKQSSPHIP